MSRHRSNLDDQTGFVLTILVAGTVYAHRAGLANVEHYLPAIICCIAGLLMVVLMFRKYKGYISWRLERLLASQNVDCMSGLEFEHFVARLLDKQGYGAVRLTEKYDYGIDIIAVKGGVTWGIQTKRYSGLVKANAVRQAVTALKKYHCDRAMVITDSYYSKVAKELAKANDCLLIDRGKIVAEYKDML